MTDELVEKMADAFWFEVLENDDGTFTLYCLEKPQETFPDRDAAYAKRDCLNATAALAELRETHHLIPKDQEPVGWLYQWKDNEPVYMPQRRDWADYPNNAGWTETPLFAPEKRHDV